MSNRVGAYANTSQVDEGLRAHMTRTYSLIARGLLLTAVTAWAVSAPASMAMLQGPEGLTGLGWAAMFAPLALLLAATFGLTGSSYNAMRCLYWAFTALQGPGIALLVSRYTDASVVNAAAAAAMAFGAASLFGYTTGRRLDSLGSFMFMGLIGLIGASLLNLFLGSPAIDFAVSCAAIVVFTGLAAWETQMIKEAYGAHASEHDADRARYAAALGLYLDVINLFSAWLGLTGERE